MYLYKLESKAAVFGGNLIWSLSGLPKGYRVRKFDLYASFTGTKTAGVDALDGDAFCRWLASVRIGNLVQVDGVGLHLLRRAVHGRIVNDPTDVAAAGAAFTATFNEEVPFRDPRQSGSDDGSMPTSMLEDKQLEVQLAAGDVHAVGTLVATAGTVRLVAELVHEDNVPQVNRLVYLDPGAQDFPIPAGIIKEAFIYKSDAAAVTGAEVSSVDLDMDGTKVLDNILDEQLAQAYDSNAVADSAAELGLGASYAFLPLVHHDRSGKSHLTKQPAAERAGRVQLSGTLTSPRVLLWYATLKDPTTVAQSAAKMGVDPTSAAAYEPAVASKSPLAKPTPGGRLPKKARLSMAALPGKLRAVAPPVRR